MSANSSGVSNDQTEFVALSSKLSLLEVGREGLVYDASTQDEYLDKICNVSFIN